MKIRELSEKGIDYLETVEKLKERGCDLEDTLYSLQQELMMEKSRAESDSGGSASYERIEEISRLIEKTEEEIGRNEEQIEEFQRLEKEAVDKINEINRKKLENIHKLYDMLKVKYNAELEAAIRKILQGMNEAEAVKDQLLTALGYSAEGTRFPGGEVSSSGFSPIDLSASSSGASMHKSSGDIKAEAVNFFMNNFNADQWKGVLSKERYLERLEDYRNMISSYIGEEKAGLFTVDQLEQLSRVQNHAFRANLDLTEEELTQLFSEALYRKGNLVTSKIEYKMDRALQKKYLSLMMEPMYGIEKWQKSTILERKSILESFLSEMNGVLEINVNPEIEYFYNSESGVRGGYNPKTNKIMINEYMLSTKSSYKCMQTLVHEMRHAYQRSAVSDPGNKLVSAETIAAWEDNMQIGNYKDPEEEGVTDEEYLAQPVEWDAKSFAMQLNELAGIMPAHEGSWGINSYD